MTGWDDRECAKKSMPKSNQFDNGHGNQIEEQLGVWLKTDKSQIPQVAISKVGESISRTAE